MKHTSKMDELVVELDTVSGWYLQAQFQFSRKDVLAECYKWDITDAAGVNVNLQALTVDKFAEVSEEIVERVNFHILKYTDALEEQYVAGEK